MLGFGSGVVKTPSRTMDVTICVVLGFGSGVVKTPSWLRRLRPLVG